MSNLQQLVDQGVCSLPWVHTEISLQSDTVRPCCKYTESLGKSSEFKKVWFGKNFNDLRHKLSNNIVEPKCQSCNVSNDVFSYKSWKNTEYTRLNRLNIDVTESQLPSVFHFSLKNVCNLACRMCSPLASSTFENIVTKSGILQKYYTLPKENDISIDSYRGSFSNLKHLTISGGEPLVDRDCIKLLEIVDSEAKDIDVINFSTNLTKMNKLVLDKLNSMDSKSITLSISLDGPKNIHEYIRYGCNWNDIIENMKYILEHYSRLRFAVNTTISALNVDYVIESLETFHQMEQDFDFKFIGLMSSPVLYPSYLHPRVLPENVKNYYLEKLKSYKCNTIIRNSENLIPTAINLLSEETVPEDYTKFNEFIAEFDRIADTNLTEIYPEFAYR